MKYLISCIIIFLVIHNTQSQKYSTKLKDVSIEELEIKVCSIDSSASIFIIHDTRETYFKAIKYSNTSYL